MPYSHIPGLITQRVQELQELVRVCRLDPQLVCNDAKKSIRGLVYVGLFGLYERVVAECVTAALDQATRLSIRLCDLKDGCRLFAMHADLQSYRSLGPTKSWENGLRLMRRLASDQPAALDVVFPADGSFMRHTQLRLIWDLFDLPGEPWPEGRLISRVDELVEARNRVAHGEKSAGEEGSALSTDDIETRVRDIEILCTHITLTFEAHTATEAGFTRLCV